MTLSAVDDAEALKKASDLGTQTDDCAKEQKKLIAVSVIGEDIPLNSDDEEICINIGRIERIQNLEKCPKLRTLSLLSQEIKKIENLDALVNLEVLELYQNQIHKIENISHLKKLKLLDLAFNKIDTIENLDGLENLECLYLSSNRLGQIKNLDSLTKLRVLELGSNKIREIENLDKLPLLEELWLGRNKITSAALPVFVNLKRLSIQSNRLTSWDVSIFRNCPHLEELYLSHNALPNPPEDIKLIKELRILDLAANHITSLENISMCAQLTDLWLNDTEIKDVEQLKHLAKLECLTTIYLERTPFQLNSGPSYRSIVSSHAPSVEQIDAVLVPRFNPVNAQP